MKGLSLLAAGGLAFALSVGAQTTSDEQQQPTREQRRTERQSRTRQGHD